VRSISSEGREFLENLGVGQGFSFRKGAAGKRPPPGGEKKSDFSVWGGKGCGTLEERRCITKRKTQYYPRLFARGVSNGY